MLVEGLADTNTKTARGRENGAGAAALAPAYAEYIAAYSVMRHAHGRSAPLSPRVNDQVGPLLPREVLRDERAGGVCEITSISLIVSCSARGVLEAGYLIGIFLRIPGR